MIPKPTMGMADLKAKIRSCCEVGCGTPATSDDEDDTWADMASEEFSSRRRDMVLAAMRRPAWDIILVYPQRAFV